MIPLGTKVSESAKESESSEPAKSSESSESSKSSEPAKGSKESKDSKLAEGTKESKESKESKGSWPKDEEPWFYQGSRLCCAIPSQPDW